MSTVDPLKKGLTRPEWLQDVKWNSQGLVPVVAQEHGSGKVLMLAWMNREALTQTVLQGEAIYWSRSRGTLWHKGETSGNVQTVREMYLDCDGDTILLTVEQQGGAACHTGRHSCFFRKLRAEDWEAVEPVLRDPKEMYGVSVSDLGQHEDQRTDHGIDRGSMPKQAQPQGPDTTRSVMDSEILQKLAAALKSRRQAAPETSYVASLYTKGLDCILKKVGEEATETVLAAKDGDPDKLIYETADLWFHTLVMLAHQGLEPNDVLRELERRFGQSGLAEKASRGGIDKP